MIKQNFLCLLFAMIFYHVNCQHVTDINPVYLEIQELKSTNQTFKSKHLLIPNQKAESRRASKIIDGSYFALNKVTSATLRRSSHQNISIPLHLNGKDILLELKKIEIHADGFGSNNRYIPGAHYRGIVSGSQNSLVSLSIFDNELIGIINYQGENLTVGKIKNDDDLHIIYNERIQSWDSQMDCGVKDDGIIYSQEQLSNPAAGRTAGDCIREEINIHHTLTSHLGGVTQATNYATGLFNNHKTLCANDGFTVTLSELKIWTAANPAPWAAQDYTTLDNWQNATGAINGDLAYCAFYEAGFGGGVAASIGGLCPSNPDGSKAVGGHVGTIQNVPTYSQDVFLISHEMGHLFGARHTHACVWNGNGTAIDGCAGFVEGGCALPPSASPGTVMSYCAPDVDLNEGYHPQVKNAILNYIANSTCTSPCGSGQPTCTDGIQNGQETGVDCGGPDCPPCSGGNCTDVTVRITLDNYPGETTWSISDANGAVVTSGGPYGNEPNGSTVSITTCLVDGCFDFKINDSYGDGICCAYGNGSYEVADADGNILASGGEFTSEEITNFCLPTTPAPTCSDGIQNGNETGVDCGGPDCAPCSTTCTDVNISITLDNYPGETEWWILNENNELVATGGPYDQSNPGETISITECLVDGCYDFVLYDAYGDGICCTYGNGSYDVTANGNVVASGGSFGYYDVTNFCLPTNNNQYTANEDLMLTFKPNPVKDALSISTNKIVDRVLIFNSKGNNVKDIPMNGQHVQLSVYDLAAGLYFITIQHEDELVREKFIKVD